MLNMLKICTLAFSLLAITTQADQTNPELDELFELLQSTEDLNEAGTLTREIWKNWYQSDNEDITRLMEAGEINMRRGLLAEAIDVYTEIIGIDPEFAEGWNRRATIYFLMGEYELSTQDVAETLQREPRHFGALSGQGMIYMRLHERELALKFYEKALEVNPHMLSVRQNIELIKKLLEDEVI